MQIGVGLSERFPVSTLIFTSELHEESLKCQEVIPLEDTKEVFGQSDLVLITRVDFFPTSVV